MKASKSERFMDDWGRAPVESFDDEPVVMEALSSDEEGPVKEVKRRPQGIRRQKSILDIVKRRKFGTDKVVLKFDDVRFEVIDNKGKQREILRGLSGFIRKGELIAIMGSSGAGKTSLFNIISGRQANSSDLTVSGSLQVQGKKHTLGEKEIEYDVAYVMQQDILTPTFTCWEQFRFAARMRMPNFLEERSIRARADEMCELMGLVKAKDTLIGDELIPGISGGQKKRVAVGSELVHDPDFLFLDEPTSGLDSHTALKLCRDLRRLARKGHCIVVVIHQPSAEVFAQFDTLWLLARGKFVYNGPINGISSYFNELGHPNPPNTNIADHIISVIHDAGDDVSEQRIERLISEWEVSTMRAKLESADATMLQARDRKSEIKRSRSTVNGISMHGGEPPGICMQLKELVSRDLLAMKRNKALIQMKIVQMVMSSLLGGLIFFGIDATYPTGLQNILGASFFCLMCCSMIICSNTVLIFPAAKMIFERERRNRMYATWIFWLAKIVLGLHEVVFVIPYCVITKYMIDLRISLEHYIIFNMCMVYCTAGLGLLIGSLAPDPATAARTMGPIMMPQLLLCGFLVSLDSVWVVLKWFKWINPFYYAYESLLGFEVEGKWYDCEGTCPLNQYEFNGVRCVTNGTNYETPLPLDFCDLDEREYSGAFFVDVSKNIDVDNRWMFLLVLLALGSAFRFGSLLLLAKNNGW